MQTENILFTLLQSQICNTYTSALPASLTEEELRALYTLAHRHDVAPIAARALSRHHLLGYVGVFDDFRQAMAEAAYWYEQFRFELSEICRVLSKADIPHIPLKGAVIRTLYPDPWMRTSCDIDVLVQHEHLKKAIDVLTLTLHYRTPGGKKYHDISLLSPNGLLLELHFSIKENMHTTDPLLERVWEYSVPQKEDGMTYCMSNEYLFFHVIAHAAYHFRSGGCGIRPLMDLYLMQKNLPINGEILADLLGQSALTSFYSGMCALIGVWFEGQAHTDLTQKAESYILSGGVYGSRKNHEAMQQQDAGSDGQYILRRIFMPYDKLKIKYPILNKCCLLAPFCHIARWFGLLRAGKIPQRLLELQRIRNLDIQAKKDAGDLLRELGL